MGKNSQDNRMNVRDLVLETLLSMEKDPTLLSHLVIRDVLKKYDYLPEEDKAFFKTLTEGVTERRITLDYVIDLFSKKKTEKMKPFIRTDLRLGAYQILYMDRVPDFSACNEAVISAKEHSFGELSGFVNGILRAISREKDHIKFPVRGNANYLSVMYSVPKETADLLQKTYGGKRAEQMLASSFLKTITLRVPEKRNAGFLKKNADFVTAHPYGENLYVLNDGCSLKDLSGFDDGLFTVQDAGSALSVKTAGIREGDRVYDVAAAPGGKSVYAAELAGKTGHVSARDLSEKKLYLIGEYFSRMRIPEENYDIASQNGCVLRDDLKECFDVVLADLPCSGLGVLSKKSDIKYHVSKESLQELKALQLAILNTVKNYVKPGGILLYSTCTVNPGENTENRAAFLTANPEFAAVPIEDDLPAGLRNSLSAEELAACANGELQLLQGVHASDGFYIAKFRRNENNA